MYPRHEISSIKDGLVHLAGVFERLASIGRMSLPGLHLLSPIGLSYVHGLATNLIYTPWVDLTYCQAFNKAQRMSDAPITCLVRVHSVIENMDLFLILSQESKGDDALAVGNSKITSCETVSHVEYEVRPFRYSDPVTFLESNLRFVYPLSTRTVRLRSSALTRRKPLTRTRDTCVWRFEVSNGFWVYFAKQN
ncbi:hypothetical protein K504DRAFT_502043 [Pleomassaria siparia CBS 279.74]|uniref:Uncharacterized protein n=1 Tax=Pleomassaria siparia CBS 279.74 TaxID=1314801 RepID=A0A6G1KAB7_9PLEO|nr:hypothetical protein K504DRAFT_502043 [Pleomassaria siparia CBS 279.74]